MKCLTRTRRGIFLLLLFFFLFAPALRSQQPDAARSLRLAQSLEQAGEWERAAAVYESLVQLDPLSYVYFEGLRRSYTRLKRYEEAVTLVERRLRLNPKDPVLLSTLGALYYHQGKPAHADSVWETVVRSNPSNVNGYRIIASQMLEFRLFDKAIDLYKEARVATGDPTLFAEELAAMYAALLQYREATEEYVGILIQKPQQLSYVQSRLATFTAKPSGSSTARRVVQRAIDARPDHIQLRLLMAWLMMEEGDYASAYTQYKEIDALKGTRGIEVFNFAQRAMQENEFAVAAQAYKEVLSNHGDNGALQPHARFGYARTLEELAKGDEKQPGRRQSASGSEENNEDKPVGETRGPYTDVVREYEALVRDYPGSEIAAQSLFRIGSVRMNQLYDLDGALHAFREVQRMRVRKDQIEEASMKIGEILVGQNKLEEAAGVYTELSKSSNVGTREWASFRQAEIDYFQGQFEKALETLENLTQKSDRDLVNDALRLTFFINDNKDADQEALKLYARGDLLSRQRKYAQALEYFRLIQTSHPAAPLTDTMMMHRADLYLFIGVPDSAVQELKSLVVKEASIVRDQAQFRLGGIYESVLIDRQRAIEAYETVITEFPNSIYADEARRRIRDLRGDSI